MAGRRGRTAPVQVLVVLAVVVLVLLVLPRLRGVDAGGPSGTTSTGSTSGRSTAGDGPPASGAALAYGPGPQQSYSVHTPSPAGSCRYRYRDGKPLPDPACTPGALNPKVTPATIGRTICRSGYSSQIRPPVSITDREKRDSARAYGYRGSLRTAEYDHLVPLSLGGDPNDNRNLWLQPNDDARATSTQNGKDAVEDRLRAAVCSRKVDLVAAQRAVATDWTTALDTLGLA